MKCKYRFEVACASQKPRPESLSIRQSLLRIYICELGKGLLGGKVQEPKVRVQNR